MSSKYIPYRIAQAFGYNPVYITDDEITYLCPFCPERRGSPDTSGHLNVNTKTFLYHCFRCDISGRVEYRKNADDSKIYSKNLVTNKDQDEIINSINKMYDTPSEFIFKIPMNKVTENVNATKYLLDRGFTFKQMEYYDLRVGNYKQEFGRIIIPNKINRLIYTDMYAARTFIGMSPKYHNPYQVDKAKIVFNLHRINDGDTIILVEGPLTAIAAGYHAVASYGKTLSEYQASLIALKKPKRIYVNYDFEAEEWSHKACDLLSSMTKNTEIIEVLMKDDRDAADMSKEEYADVLASGTVYNSTLSKISEIV